MIYHVLRSKLLLILIVWNNNLALKNFIILVWMEFLAENVSKYNLLIDPPGVASDRDNNLQYT